MLECGRPPSLGKDAKLSSPRVPALYDQSKKPPTVVILVKLTLCVTREGNSGATHMVHDADSQCLQNEPNELAPLSHRNKRRHVTVRVAAGFLFPQHW